MGSCAQQAQDLGRQQAKSWYVKEKPSAVVTAIKMEFDNPEDVMAFIGLPKDSFYESDGAVFLGDVGSVILRGMDTPTGCLLGVCTWHYIVKFPEGDFLRVSNKEFEELFAPVV